MFSSTVRNGGRLLNKYADDMILRKTNNVRDLVYIYCISALGILVITARLYKYILQRIVGRLDADGGNASPKTPSL